MAERKLSKEVSKTSEYVTGVVPRLPKPPGMKSTIKLKECVSMGAVGAVGAMAPTNFQGMHLAPMKSRTQCTLAPSSSLPKVLCTPHYGNSHLKMVF